ncbi:MAG: hypothetical protein CNLJKLNK_00771 [Holosporales bacterium]
MYFRLFLLNCTLLSASFCATYPLFPFAVPHMRVHNPYATGVASPVQSGESSQYLAMKEQLKHLEDQTNLQFAAQQKTEQDMGRYCAHFTKTFSDYHKKQEEIESAFLVLEQKRAEEVKMLSTHQDGIERFLATFPQQSDQIFKVCQARLTTLEDQISKCRKPPSCEEFSALENQARALSNESIENKRRIAELENKIEQIQKMMQAPASDGFSKRLMQHDRAITSLEKKLNEIKEAIKEATKNATQKKASQENGLQALRNDLDRQLADILSKSAYLKDAIKCVQDKLDKRHTTFETQTELEMDEAEPCPVSPAEAAPLVAPVEQKPVVAPVIEQEHQSVVLEKPKETNRDMKGLMKQKISEIEKKIKCESKYNLIIKNVVAPFMEKHFPALSIIESFDENDPQFWITVQEIIARAHEDKQMLQNFKTVEIHDPIEITSGFLQANQEGINSSPENKINANNLILFIILSINYIAENGNELTFVNNIQKTKSCQNIRLLELMIFTILEKIRIQVNEKLDDKSEFFDIMIRLKLNFFPILNVINQHVLSDEIYEKTLAIIDTVIENEVNPDKSIVSFLISQRSFVIQKYHEEIIRNCPEYRQDKTNVKFNDVTIECDDSFPFQVLKILQIISRRKEPITKHDKILINALYEKSRANILPVYQNIFTFPFTVPDLTAENARTLVGIYAKLGLWRAVEKNIKANGTDLEKRNFENIKKMLLKKT